MKKILLIAVFLLIAVNTWSGEFFRCDVCNKKFPITGGYNSIYKLTLANDPEINPTIYGNNNPYERAHGDHKGSVYHICQDCMDRAIKAYKERGKK